MMWLRRFSIFVSCLLCAVLAQAASTSVTLEGARLSSQPHSARLVLELSEANAYKVFVLNNPKRLVVDLPKVKLATDLNDVDLRDSPFKRIRHAYQKNRTLRMVFDLQHHVSINAFPLKPFGLYGDRLVVDMDYQLASPEKVPPVRVKKKKHDVIIALDPGHGGHDSGAMSHGLKEKDIVLKIAKRLKKLIDDTPGLHAVLTRDGDYFIPLRERIHKARRYKANIFIAIHADAYTKPHSHGAAVYALSERGASSEAARWLAAKENTAALGEVSLGDKDQVLKSVLLDLSQTATIDSSLRLGKLVLQQMGYFARLHHPNVEQAPFVVLKSPDIPSILIETGFISNPKEAKLLKTPSYQSKLANAIHKGLKRYIKKYHG